MLCVGDWEENRKKAKGNNHVRNSSNVSSRSREFRSVSAFGLNQPGCRCGCGPSRRQSSRSRRPESQRIWQRPSDGDHRYGAGGSDCNLRIGYCVHNDRTKLWSLVRQESPCRFPAIPDNKDPSHSIDLWTQLAMWLNNLAFTGRT